MALIKDKSVLIVIILVILVLIWLEITTTQSEVTAQQFGTNYFWSDITLTTTTSIDSFFVTRWENITVYGDTSDFLLRIGAPDTTGWSSRPFIKIKAGTSLSFGPATKLKRLEWKTVSGSDVFTMVGYKRTPQF